LRTEEPKKYDVWLRKANAGRPRRNSSNTVGAAKCIPGPDILATGKKTNCSGSESRKFTFSCLMVARVANNSLRYYSSTSIYLMKVLEVRPKKVDAKVQEQSF